MTKREDLRNGGLDVGLWNAHLVYREYKKDFPNEPFDLNKIIAWLDA